MHKIYSVLLGIIVATILFFLLNTNKYKQQYHGPNSNTFKTKIFKLNDKCYVFKPQMYMCPDI